MERNNNNAAYWPAVVGTIQPQLVTIALMTNDYQGGVDPATSKTNLLAMIAAVRAKCTVPPTIVLLTYPARGDVTSPAYPWASYVAVAASIASADTGVAHLDLSARYTSPATSNALGNWDSDKVHPTDKGHGLIAETVSRSSARGRRRGRLAGRDVGGQFLDEAVSDVLVATVGGCCPSVQ